MFRKCFAQNNKNLYNIINQTHIHANILLPKLRVASSSLVYRSQNKGLNNSTLAKFSPFLLPNSDKQIAYFSGEICRKMTTFG